MLRTKSGLPDYCCWNHDRHGKRRVRFRKAGFSTYLTGTPWSEDFMRQYAAAVDGVKAQAGDVGAARTKPAHSMRYVCRIIVRPISVACDSAHNQRVATSLSISDWR